MILYLLQKHCRSVAGNFHNTNEKGKKEKKRARGGGRRKRKTKRNLTPGFWLQ